MTECEPTDGVLYSYRLVYAQCQQYDDVTNSWSPGSCEALPGTTASRAKFKSNLLGSIGAGVFVGPNTIDFSTVFDNLGGKLIEVTFRQKKPIQFVYIWIFLLEYGSCWNRHWSNFTFYTNLYFVSEVGQKGQNQGKLLNVLIYYFLWY